MALEGGLGKFGGIGLMTDVRVFAPWYHAVGAPLLHCNLPQFYACIQQIGFHCALRLDLAAGAEQEPVRSRRRCSGREVYDVDAQSIPFRSNARIYRPN